MSPRKQAVGEERGRTHTMDLCDAAGELSRGAQHTSDRQQEEQGTEPASPPHTPWGSPRAMSSTSWLHSRVSKAGAGSQSGVMFLESLSCSFVDTGSPQAGLELTM